MFWYDRFNMWVDCYTEGDENQDSNISPLFFCTFLTTPWFGLMSLEVSCCLLLDLVGQWVDLEAVKTRHKLVSWPLGSVLWVDHEEHVRESGPEICPVSVVVSRRFGSVDVHALGAIEFDHRLPRHVRQSDGQHGLVLTVNTRAVTKVPSLVLLNHLGNASVCQNVSSVNKTIEHLSRLFYQVRLVGVIFQFVIRLQVEDHVQRLPVVRNLLVEAGQVELVLNVVLVHLAEELISSQTTEPRYPGDLF